MIVSAMAILQGGAEDGGDLLRNIGLVVLAGVLLLFLFVFLRYANLYLRSVLTKAGVGLFDMFAMSLRKVQPAVIVNASVMLVQSRIEGVHRRAIFKDGSYRDEVMLGLVRGDWEVANR